jgi:hypothetical protein
MFTNTVSRVPENTDSCVNDAIREQTEANVFRYSKAGRAAIERRLAQLDEEWDIERCLETMASSFTLLGVTLGIMRDRRFLAIPLVVQAFFLQHALQGWCPPLPILRRLGVRTSAEIDEERVALKALRGDFDQVQGPASAMQAARI